MEVAEGQLEDPVDRLRKFRELHPDIKITPPGQTTMLWRAEKGGETLAEAFWLKTLMDVLESGKSQVEGSKTVESDVRKPRSEALP